MSDIMEEIWNQGKQEGFKIGYKEGYKIGYKEGYKIGYKEGFKEGKQEACQDCARRMLNAGKLSLWEIAEYSGLSLAEVKKLQSEKSA